MKKTVAILASTYQRARHTRERMGLNDSVILLSAGGHTLGRGMNLDMLFVDQSAWPLTEAVAASVLPCLTKTSGKLRRIS